MVPYILNMIYFYRTHDQTEVDIIIVKNGQPYIVIECKATLSPKRTRGFTTAIQDLGTKRNYIVIPSKDANYPIDKSGEQIVIGIIPLIKMLHEEFGG